MKSNDFSRATEISRTCACFNLRKAARAVTQMYDTKLRPAGIRATQFTILVAIRAHAPVNISDLARTIVTDRTTLARNLKPLVRNGLIIITPGEDRRLRQAALTTKGKNVLTRALPLWEQAQAEFIAEFGPARLDRMMADLTRTVAAIHTA